MGTGISLYCDTPDATIYYTLDKTLPTTDSAHYTGEITISRDMVIKAFAVREGYTDSEVSVFYYYVNNDEPVEEDEVLPLSLNQMHQVNSWKKIDTKCVK